MHCDVLDVVENEPPVAQPFEGAHLHPLAGVSVRNTLPQVHGIAPFLSPSSNPPLCSSKNSLHNFLSDRSVTSTNSCTPKPGTIPLVHLSQQNNNQMLPSAEDKWRAISERSNDIKWIDTVEKNKQLIEAWQGRMALYHRSTPVSQGSVSSQLQQAPTYPFLSFKMNKTIYDGVESSGARKSDPRSDSGTDGPCTSDDKTSSKGKSKQISSSGTDSAGSRVSPSNSSGSTNSGSLLGVSTKRRGRTCGKEKKPKKNQLVNLFPRKKKTEEFRAKDHMIISLENLTPLFHLSLKQAAAKLGICTTALKSVCRKFGLKRWPYQLLKQVHKCACFRWSQSWACVHRAHTYKFTPTNTRDRHESNALRAAALSCVPDVYTEGTLPFQNNRVAVTWFGGAGWKQRRDLYAAAGAGHRRSWELRVSQDRSGRWCGAATSLRKKTSELAFWEHAGEQ